MGGVEVQHNSFLTSAVDRSDQLDAPAALYPEKTMVPTKQKAWLVPVPIWTFWRATRYCPSPTHSKQHFGPTQPSIQWVSGGSFPGSKAAGHGYEYFWTQNHSRECVEVNLHLPHMLSRHGDKLSTGTSLPLPVVIILSVAQTNKQTNKQQTMIHWCRHCDSARFAFMRHPTPYSVAHSPFRQRFYCNYHIKAWLRMNLLHRTNPLQAIHYEHMCRYSKQYTRMKLQEIVTKEYYVTKNH